MLDFLLRKIRLWFGENHNAPTDPKRTDEPQEHLTGSLPDDTNRIRQELAEAPGFIIHQFHPEGYGALLFLETLVPPQEVGRIIGLLHEIFKSPGAKSPRQISADLPARLSAGAYAMAVTVRDVIDAILAGDCVLFVADRDQAFVLNTRCEITRPISEPVNEIVLKGARTGFIEALPVNLALLQQKIKNSKLTCERFTIGKTTRTEIGLVYIKGVASPALIAAVLRRLKGIDADCLLNAQDISEFITDNRYTPFRTTAESERPEFVASKLMAGRVAILIDGTPVVLTVPMLFIESFQNPDDYSFHFYYGTLVRWLRILAYCVSVFGPALVQRQEQNSLK